MKLGIQRVRYWMQSVRSLKLGMQRVRYWMESVGFLYCVC
jgi:hypothetical protein